jgi:EAL and modified HD-GYP domain-containing signal transduction protein
MTEAIAPLREVLLGRQPILDIGQELFGYELLFRDGRRDPLQPDERLAATACVVCTAFSELGIGDALGQKKAFINADERFIADDALEALPPSGVVLELDFPDVPDETLLTRCRTLRERGYTLALTRYAGLDTRSAALLPLVGVVKIDVGAVGSELPQVAGSLARLPLKLLAEKVETREEMERCRQLGFDYLQGYYFARPVVVSGRQLSASQLGLIRLLNLVARDAELKELEDSFKREPGLTINLLRLVNTVGVGLGRRVESLRQAVTVLGRRQLLRWLQLLLMASPENAGHPEKNPLLQLAALRGRLMEVLAQRLAPGDRSFGDQAFLCGIMSLMPVALGLPMEEILAQIAMAPDAQQALTTRGGALGELLDLVLQFDDGDWDACDRLLAASKGLNREALSTGLSETLAWLHGEHAAN